MKTINKNRGLSKMNDAQKKAVYMDHLGLDPIAFNSKKAQLKRALKKRYQKKYPLKSIFLKFTRRLDAQIATKADRLIDKAAELNIENYLTVKSANAKIREEWQNDGAPKNAEPKPLKHHTPEFPLLKKKTKTGFKFNGNQKPRPPSNVKPKERPNPRPVGKYTP